MLWLIATISAYFLQAIAALVDKYLLKSRIPSAKVYAFYVGILNVFVVLFIPLGFYVPAFSLIVLNFFAGAFFLLGLFFFYKALREFEVSRVVPAIGGILPLFVYCWVCLFFRSVEVLGACKVLSLLLLISGTVLIVYSKNKSITFKSFQISVLAAFLFSVYFILSKFAYEAQPFWSAFIWIRISSLLIGILFLLSKEVRDEIFRERRTFKAGTGLVFMANQLAGGASSVLQSWAVALVPFGFLAFVNALEGTKYVFVLILAVAVSIKFPRFLSEEISRKIILQKIAAVLLIAAGLAILVL